MFNWILTLLKAYLKHDKALCCGIKKNCTSTTTTEETIAEPDWVRSGEEGVHLYAWPVLEVQCVAGLPGRTVSAATPPWLRSDHSTLTHKPTRVHAARAKGLFKPTSFYCFSCPLFSPFNIFLPHELLLITTTTSYLLWTKVVSYRWIWFSVCCRKFITWDLHSLIPLELKPY